MKSRADRTRWPASGEVRTYAVDLNDARLEQPALQRIFTEDELARAARFHFDRDRQRFLAARAFLRTVLAAYLDVAPGDVRFAYSSRGKPAVEAPSTTLHFNLTHSGHWAALAIALDPVGIDIECVRPVPELEAIAHTSFTPAEERAVLAVEGEQRVRRFYTCWTRKEAFVKATGIGIGAPLQDFEVTVDPTEPVRFTKIAVPGEAPADAWSLLVPELALETDLIAAIAMPVPQARCTIESFDALASTRLS